MAEKDQSRKKGQVPENGKEETAPETAKAPEIAEKDAASAAPASGETSAAPAAKGDGAASSEAKEASAVDKGEAAPAPANKKQMTKAAKKKRQMIRNFIIALVLLVAAIVVWRLFSGKGETSTVVTDMVGYNSIVSTVEGNGLTKPKNSEVITLTTAGTVLDVFVIEGQQVAAGTPLFTVDSEAASTAVKKAQDDVEGYEKTLSKLQKDLAGLNLASSYPGKLMEVVTLNPGDTIAKGEAVATVADDTRLRLKQYYSYAYAGEVKAGQTADVSLPTLMSTISGKVEKVNMVSRITPEGSKLFEAVILIDNPGTLTAEMAASATISVNGETVYPYEAGKLEYYRTGKLESTVSGTVISSNLVDYLQVTAGQVLVRIDGEDSESEIFTTQQSLDEARKALDTAQKNLDNCNAVAPIDGTVMNLAIQTGQEVPANTAVISISDTSQIIVDATVDERNVSYVKPGMMVEIDQWGNPFTGTVESVSLSSKAENGVASYPMVITVDNTDGSLMTGSYINYSLVASQNDNCLVLPIQCVKTVPLDDGTTGSVVFVKANKRPDNAIDLSVPVEGVPDGYWPVVVETGISDDYNVEIKSGVEADTEVFTTVRTESAWT